VYSLGSELTLEKTLNLSGYKCQALYDKAEGTPFIFLHGLSYTIEVWERIGVIDCLLAKKIPFLALDMPYGIKSDSQPKNRDPQANVAVVAEAVKTLFDDEAPVIVGASLGGYIALNYAANYPVKGLLLVAPAYAFENLDLALKYSNFHFPVRIVWGKNDNVISGEEMRTLADKLPNAKLLVYNNAAHAAYKDQPEWFLNDLLSLYANATI